MVVKIKLHPDIFRTCTETLLKCAANIIIKMRLIASGGARIQGVRGVRGVRRRTCTVSARVFMMQRLSYV
jgi:hypothetical protein